MWGEILRFVNDEEDVRETSSPYICKGCDYKLLILDHVVNADKFRTLGAEAVLYNSQVIEERLHVWVHLLLHVAREESHVAVGKRYYWPRKENLLVPFVLVQGSGKS